MISGDTTAPTRAPEPAAATEPGRRTGTGFVVHDKGLVLTSRHVVVDAVSVEVIVPQHGSRWADLVGEDRATDLALLRLVDPPQGLPALTLGSSEDLRAGDWIVTVGNPFGGRQRNPGRTVSASAPMVALTVLPLPAQGKPANFSGGVGSSFAMKAEVKPAEVLLGDVVTLSATVTAGQLAAARPVIRHKATPAINTRFISISPS